MIELPDRSVSPGIGTSRREFLKAAGAGLGLLGLGAFPGCFEEDLGSSEGFTVWLAQSVSGRVSHSVTQNPIEGASVAMWAGFDKAALFQVSPLVYTDAEGRFSLVRAAQTGKAGDYWWFQVDDNAVRTVYVRLDVMHGGFNPAHPIQTLTRVPSKNPPDRNFDEYALLFSVPMVQVTPP